MGSHSLLQRNPPDPGIDPGSPTLQVDSLPSDPLGKPQILIIWSCCKACGILVPQPGIKPAPLHWQLRVLTTEPPGSPVQMFVFLNAFSISPLAYLTDCSNSAFSKLHGWSSSSMKGNSVILGAQVKHHGVGPCLLFLSYPASSSHPREILLVLPSQQVPSLPVLGQSLFPRDQSHHHLSLWPSTDPLFLPLTLTVYSSTAGGDFTTWKPHPVTALLGNLQ